MEDNVQTSILHVLRTDPDGGEEPRFESFEVPHEGEDLTVLAGLLWIQDHLDGTLAFRYSCRGAVCGSCAMVINGELGLACRTHLVALPREITLEPLPNLPVLRDLVVDMATFWEGWAKVRPWLVRLTDPPEKEILQSPEERDRIEQYINCILCAACQGACPIRHRNRDYIGPAALAALHRFADDSRDERGKNALSDVDTGDGVWGCRTAFRCIDACPKHVRPADGIAELRMRALRGGKDRKK